jgi:hypothetical protein
LRLFDLLRILRKRAVVLELVKGALDDMFRISTLDENEMTARFSFSKTGLGLESDDE